AHRGVDQAGFSASRGALAKDLQSYPLGLCLRAEKRAGESPAVDEDILSGDIAGLRRAEERAGRAEFIGLADAFRRHGRKTLGERRLRAQAFLLPHRLDVTTQSVGAEDAGQHEIDGDVGGDERGSYAGEKGGEAGARA